LFQIVLTGGASGGFAGEGKGGERYGGQNANDANNDEWFDEGETASAHYK